MSVPVTERWSRIEALLPELRRARAQMVDGSASSPDRDAGAKAYVKAVDEVVDHLLELHQRDVLTDIADLLEFTYGGMPA